jgi:hypothetical protein
MTSHKQTRSPFALLGPPELAGQRPPAEPPNPTERYKREPAAAGAAFDTAEPSNEMTARVREALRADSSTTQYADTIGIEARDGVVILRGVVYDLIDNDNLLAVASDVAGVAEVVDRLRVHILELGA